MTKPRLSMKLLWKYLNQYFRESEDARTLRIDKVTDFLNYVEQQMKSHLKEPTIEKD